jgi:hypothetical protein
MDSSTVMLKVIGSMASKMALSACGGTLSIVVTELENFADVHCLGRLGGGSAAAACLPDWTNKSNSQAAVFTQFLKRLLSALIVTFLCFPLNTRAAQVYV